ncbi:MAG: dihydrofolate reductase family protein [Acidimicrobiia bacterium]|jgi:dihydrofolate reductase
MARLLYVTNMSLDGYIEDENGNFDFTVPGDDFFEFITDLIRPVGTYLYGRRLYESMAVWETDPDLASQSVLMEDFANVWQTADKVVYSTTLDSVWTANTRLEKSFEASEVGHLKDSATADQMIGGAELASQAFRAGLVDDCHLFVHPILVGGGKRALPSGTPMQFDLLANHPFSSGAIHLHYRVRR